MLVSDCCAVREGLESRGWSLTLTLALTLTLTLALTLRVPARL